MTLNRPDRRNAIDADLMDELRSIWGAIGADPEVNVMLLTGAGDYFSVGGDVKAMQGRPFGDVHREGQEIDLSTTRKLITSILDLDKPIVTAINGDAIGLAATIALFTDITVMSDEARIGDTHVSRVGLVAGDGGAVIWPLLVGASRAKEFLMRGTLIKGQQAYELGLVSHVEPRGRVLAAAKEIAEELAAGPSAAIRWTKLSVNIMLLNRLNEVIPTSSALEHITFHTDDHKEATTAFAEKRQPRFTGH